MLDILIKGGRVVNGAGNPWFSADVGIADGEIVEIGNLTGRVARRTIEAGGLVVSPGFIDMHSHSDLKLFVEPGAYPKIMQGVTTEVLGQDGIGPAPLRKECRAEWLRSLTGLLGDPPSNEDWVSFEEYLEALGRVRPSINVASLVTYGAIRLFAAGLAGLEERRATPEEIEGMKDVLERAMIEGAFGLSLGMPYLPCLYAEKGELIELYKVVARFNGMMVIHLWNESDALEKSVRAAADICSAAGVPLHISHFKCAGRDNWGKAGYMLGVLEELRAGGLDVTYDQYPYVAGSTMLSCILPPWSLDGGTDHLLARLRDPAARERMKRDIENGISDGEFAWDNDAKLAGWDGLVITSVHTEANRKYEGKNLVEIGEMRGVHPADAAMDLILEEDGAVVMAEYLACEEDVTEIMKHPCQTVATDGIYGAKAHPRLYGSFARVLALYCREHKALSLEDAVKKMTSASAQRLGLRRRGILAAGMIADITVFDPLKIQDTATYADPVRHPVGIPWVIVNGSIVVENGKHTGARSGAILKRG